MAIEKVDTVGALAGRLTDRLRRIMPPGPRRDRLTEDLADTFGTDGGPIDAGACHAIEDVAHRYSRHLELHFEPGGAGESEKTPDGTGEDQETPDGAGESEKTPDGAGEGQEVEMPGWPPPDPDEVARLAGGVSAVRRLDARTCLVVLDSLPEVALARPYLTAAAVLARGASRLVLDLRANGGGDPATVAVVAGWLLGDDARQLSEVIYPDRRRQWWTGDTMPGTAFRGDAFVLVSSRTYSSAEALAYHLAVRGRVTVVGEPTRGAADHVVPVRLAPQVLGLLPEAEVRDSHTGANWEGDGVIPDIAAPADKALEAALARV